MTRIIAGLARGRKIAVPPEGTRPTSDRAREGLFSSLQVRYGFEGEIVLDLFAGSGAMGLEALSRGARSVDFVESNEDAVSVIQRNIATVKLTGTQVHHMKASSFLSAAGAKRYTMVLADPPYELADDAFTDIAEALIPHLDNGAVVVFERDSAGPETVWPAGYEAVEIKLKKRTYGAARFDSAIFHHPDAGE